MARSGTWTTVDELNYIDKLGTWSKRDVPRKVLLRGHLQGLLHRDVWEMKEFGGMKVNRDKVLERIRSEIGP